MPGGFGGRGIEGKIRAIRVARERRIPFLGICLGMQLAVCEFARHVADMDGANSTEFDPETPHPVIDLLPEQKEVSDLGGTMRLGADPIKLHADTRARELYDEAVIYERHRHRYEVNLFLRKRLEAAGLRVSGTSPDERLVEVIELDDHPFFVASQYHPEFKSRPERPAPLFREFVGAAGERAGRAGRDRAGERARHPAWRSSDPRVASSVRPASEAERRRLNETFAALCAIASPSGRERACADAVTAHLRGIGLDVIEDDTTAETGADCGNLLVRIPSRREGAPTILLAAHMDTVAVGGADRAGRGGGAVDQPPRRDPRRGQQGSRWPC